MFQGGNRVEVRLGPAIYRGRVEMASAKHRSMFVTLDAGMRLTILGLPRPKGGHHEAEPKRD